MVFACGVLSRATPIGNFLLTAQPVTFVAPMRATPAGAPRGVLPPEVYDGTRLVAPLRQNFANTVRRTVRDCPGEMLLLPSADAQ
jgi:hypothetical protein